MANIKSAKKRIITSEKSRVSNRAVKSRVTSSVRSVREAVAEGDLAKAEKAVSTCFSVLDKAAKKGVIPKNTANRKKSRLNASVSALRPA